MITKKDEFFWLNKIFIKIIFLIERITIITKYQHLTKIKQ